jgi:hypothetical protein
MPRDRPPNLAFLLHFLLTFSRLKPGKTIARTLVVVLVEMSVALFFARSQHPQFTDLN